MTRLNDPMFLFVQDGSSRVLAGYSLDGSLEDLKNAIDNFFENHLELPCEEHADWNVNSTVHDLAEDLLKTGHDGCAYGRFHFICLSRVNKTRKKKKTMQLYLNQVLIDDFKTAEDLEAHLNAIKKIYGSNNLSVQKRGNGDVYASYNPPCSASSLS